MCPQSGLLTWTLLLAALGPVSSMENVNGTQGGSVYLSVNQTLPPLAQRQTLWMFNGIQIAAGYPPNGFLIYNDDYKERCELYENTTLRLDKLTATDQGIYTLTVSNTSSGSSTATTVHLTVYSFLTPPVITANVNYPINGTNETLHCDALGQTVTSYSFHRNQEDVCSQKHVTCTESNLYFHPIMENDKGNYTCIIHNPISTNTSQPLPLPVAVHVSNVSLQSNTSATELLWVGNNSVLLTCSAFGTEVRFSWNVNGAPLPPNSRYHLNPDNSSLTISPVERNDNGSFTCTASNWFSNQTSISHELNLAWHPEGMITCSVDGATNNETVQLMCSWPGGLPSANVTLQLQQKNESRENQVIENVNKSTINLGDILFCYGSQGVLNVSCSVRLGRPDVIGFNNYSTTEVEAGSQATLSVSLSGNATQLSHQARVAESQNIPANFSWFHPPDANPVTEGNKFKVYSTPYESSLTVSSITKEDNGSYECRAVNLFGSTSFFFILNVTQGVPTTISPGSTAKPSSVLSAGEIAGIVIGVLAGLAIIGIITFFILRSKKKKSKSQNQGLTNETQIGPTEYAVVNKNMANGGVAESSITGNPQDAMDDVKYAVLRFQNQESVKPAPSVPETEYSTVKTASSKQ